MYFDEILMIQILREIFSCYCILQTLARHTGQRNLFNYDDVYRALIGIFEHHTVGTSAQFLSNLKLFSDHSETKFNGPAVVARLQARRLLHMPINFKRIHGVKNMHQLRSLNNVHTHLD